jgi:hypothetical protein
MMYFRFIFCLAFGLAGITLFLKTMMDLLFVDGRFLDDFHAYIASTSRPNRYMQVYDYEAETARVRARLVPVTKKKKVVAERTFPGIWIHPLPTPPPAPLTAPRVEYLV